MGFLNYLLGLVVGVVAVGSAARLPERPRRAAMAAAVALVISAFCHIVAAAFALAQVVLIGLHHDRWRPGRFTVAACAATLPAAGYILLVLGLAYADYTSAGIVATTPMVRLPILEQLLGPIQLGFGGFTSLGALGLLAFVLALRGVDSAQRKLVMASCLSRAALPRVWMGVRTTAAGRRWLALRRGAFRWPAGPPFGHQSRVVRVWRVPAGNRSLGRGRLGGRRLRVDPIALLVISNLGGILERMHSSTEVGRTRSSGTRGPSTRNLCAPKRGGAYGFSRTLQICLTVRAGTAPRLLRRHDRAGRLYPSVVVTGHQPGLPALLFERGSSSVLRLVPTSALAATRRSRTTSSYRSA